MTTGIVLSEFSKGHDTGSHPEQILRYDWIKKKISEKSYFSEVRKVKPVRASKEDICRVHSDEYYESLVQRNNGIVQRLDPDTVFSPGTFEAAEYSAGGGIALADEILSGRLKNGFCVSRPPGHHAEKGFAMGFCIFNNAAVTAKYLKHKGAGKVFILDWDVHHGNGTQHIFYDDDSVFFLSLHQFPYYPGTGSSDEKGSGKGLDCTLNIPLQRGSTDSDYKKAFETSVLKAMDDFHPDFIIISAGFDAHAKDPLGGMNLSTSAFEFFTSAVREKAEELCQGRIISHLEGGYDLDALADSAEAHFAALKG
ncbi:MAG TPA: histone deacetylase [Leptospiraceae bacterium]|nr:histone deacetylase [Leptospiraceae bacterium]HMZ60128.1 histone deacetylase [Leptospiraceae bacterium]HNF22826.1 histone deacetylase [Leptospiraceae bacterium]HNH07706.1 histone deacetylase [Leptospiraceae bacterium]HNI98562.1 histone deacetylase [Leptospiraceae bacterium]